MSSKDENCLFTVIRTSDAERKQISFSLSKKLGELKEILAKEFDIASDESQRIFYMGRELKSGGRSLEKLGLGRFNNNVLHVHVPPQPSSSEEEENKATVRGTKRRRVARQPDAVSLPSNPTNDEGIIEIVDDSDEEASKRRR